MCIEYSLNQLSFHPYIITREGVIIGAQGKFSQLTRYTEFEIVVKEINDLFYSLLRLDMDVCEHEQSSGSFCIFTAQGRLKKQAKVC